MYRNFVKSINLTGTMTIADLGNGYSAATVDCIKCVSGNGVVSVSCIDGGSFTWSASTNDELFVTPSSVIVSSGLFVGLKTKFTPRQTIDFQ